MSSIAARVVDHPAARVAFAILGVGVGCLFLLFGLDFLRVSPIAEPTSFKIGLSMLIGQVGWWARVALPHAFFLNRPAFRTVEALLLAVGIAITGYGLAFMPKGPAAVPLLITLLVAGVFMLFGTVGCTRPGSNNSFKGKPLRGSP